MLNRSFGEFDDVDEVFFSRTEFVINLL